MPQERNMDYDKIFDLYEINRNQLTKNETRSIRKRLSDSLDKYLEKKGLSNISWNELPKTVQDVFICYEIKPKMLKKLRDESKQRIQKNLDEYMSGGLTEGAEILGNRNHSIEESLYKRDYLKGGESEFQKQRAYQSFCQNWKEYNGSNSAPPTYEEFIENPNLSIYDYEMSKMDEVMMDMYGHIPDEVENHVNDIVHAIILEVLEKKLGLRIDYQKIRKCLLEQKNLYAEDTGIDVSDYDFQKFPETFDAFWNDIVQTNEQEDLEKEKEVIKEKYEKTKEKLMKLFMLRQQLNDLSNFYTTKA